MDNEREKEQEAPPGLIQALKRLEPKSVHRMESVDSAVLSAARRRLNRPARKGLGWWPVVRDWPRWVQVPALAAAALLLVLLVRPLLQPDFATEDVNRDGRVDILDAFGLVREIQSGTTVAPSLDLNGDGIVDRRDADIIASEAVSLEKPGETNRKGGRS